ncbi:MAG: transporter [Chloroflexi bacterium]|nr:transporter [Chloroflexota bacterium]
MTSNLWRNRNFNIFWAGQTFSNLGDSFALIALPLLVLQATGSVAQMGLVTATFGISSLFTNLISGVVVDRVDRRLLMIWCDIGRLAVNALIPLAWWLYGPQIWLIYLVTAVSASLGSFFQVSYITAITHLVNKDQLTSAHGRLQTTFGFAFVTGPMLAGFVSAQVGPAMTVGANAVSFTFSAISLAFVRFLPVEGEAAHEIQPKNLLQEWLSGLKFLWNQPVLRTVTIILGFYSLINTASLDLFIFHLKHDWKEDDNAVGIMLGLSSIGFIIGGVTVAWVRQRLGFGFCFLGGIAVGGVSTAFIGLAPSFLLICLMGMAFTYASSVQATVSMALRQAITPNHMLGRVTAIFWALNAVPGPLGAAIATTIAEKTGTVTVLVGIGIFCLVLALVGLFTPVHQAHPEKTATQFSEPELAQPLP